MHIMSDNTMSKKKAPVKNQHFVPQFYLRNFSTDKKSIGAYILKSGKFIKQASISDQASKDYFYSDDMKIEGALGLIEKNAAHSINKIIKSPQSVLSSEDYGNILYFTVVQLGRTTLAAEDYLASEKALISKINVQTEPFGKKYNAEDNPYAPKTPVLAPLGIFHSAYQNGCFDNLAYRILINETPIPFITGDNPACLYNQLKERIQSLNYSIASVGFQLYIPLSPQIGIIFFDPKIYKVGNRKQSSIHVTNSKDILEFNKLLACNTANTVFTSTSILPTQNYKKLVSLAKNYKPTKREVAQTIPYSNSGFCIILRTVSMYCKFKPSFIKELSRAKKITKDNTNDILLLRPESTAHKGDMYKSTNQHLEDFIKENGKF